MTFYPFGPNDESYTPKGHDEEKEFVKEVFRNETGLWLAIVCYATWNQGNLILDYRYRVGRGNKSRTVPLMGPQNPHGIFHFAEEVWSVMEIMDDLKGEADQKALELLASLLKVMREHGGLEELYVPIEVLADEHAERGRHDVGESLRQEADILREGQRELDALIQWAEQKLGAAQEGGE